MTVHDVVEDLLRHELLAGVPHPDQREAEILTAMRYYRTKDVSDHYGIPSSTLYALRQRYPHMTETTVPEIPGAKSKATGTMADAMAYDVAVLLRRGMSPAEAATQLGISLSRLLSLAGPLASLDAGYREDGRARL